MAAIQASGTVNLRDLNWLSISLRILIAGGVGCLIGLERESKNHPAGFRTYLLVCLGSCLVMMTNQFLYTTYSSGDPARLGAQVISGIGFLGAGTILVTRNNQVRGLTTAAALWATACIGLAAGAGFYGGAIAVGALLVLVMVFFKALDNKVRIDFGYIHLYIHFDDSDVVDDFLKKCKEDYLHVVDMQPVFQKSEREGGIVVLVSLKAHYRTDHDRVIERLSAIQGVRYLEEI